MTDSVVVLLALAVGAVAGGFIDDGLGLLLWTVVVFLGCVMALAWAIGVVGS